MEKIVVHTIKVGKAQERVQFQIPMPRNLQRLTGILITSTATSNFIRKYNAGAVSLWIPERRDVFYSELVRGQAFEHGIASFNLKFNPDRFTGLPWLDGTKVEFFPIEAGRECRLMEGYYENLAANDFSYLVNIYLKLEV